MPSVLFICTANQYRSPLAALSFSRALLNNRPPGKWVVESAGTWAKAGITPQAFMVKIARELGLQGLENHRSQQVDRKMMDAFDLILVMELGHKEALRSEFLQAQKRVYLLSEVADGESYNIVDPLTPEIDPYKVAKQIDQLINKGFARIIEAAEYFERRRNTVAGGM
jgi:protein-tyrosine phosphatase